MAKMKIGEIVDDGDRVLIYPPEHSNALGRYHVIASPRQVTERDLKVGDWINYEPAGISNFGWLK